MSLEAQLSALGLLVAFGVIVLIWLAALAVGTLLLPESKSEISTIDRMALGGPWGLVFLVGTAAALLSSGRSLLSPLPLLQVALWLADLLRNRRRAAEHAPTDDGLPRGKAIAIFFAVIVFGAQLTYLVGTMPYRGDGQWQMPHEDYAWWGLLSQRVATDGVESLSPPAARALVSPGTPVLHWYHWFEFWLAGLVSRSLGLNSMLVLLLVVFPLFVGMAAVCAAALMSHCAKWSRSSWLLSLGPLVVTSLYDVFAIAGIVDFGWTYAVVNNTNYLLGVIWAFCWTLQILRRRYARAALSMGIAALLAPPLVPLLLAVLCATAFWTLLTGHAGRRVTTLTFAARGMAWIGIAYLWLVVSDHAALGPQAAPIRIGVSAIRAQWQSLLLESASHWSRALAYGAPMVFGLYHLRKTRSSGGHADGVAIATALAVMGVIVSYPVVGVLGGWSGSEASYVSDLMWQCLLLPLGWIGLCSFATDAGKRWIPGVVMASLVVGGIGNVVDEFRFDSSRSLGTFTAPEIASLTSMCGGRTVGYFAPESDRWFWWMSVQSGWTSLSGCDFVRINQTAAERTPGNVRAFWEASAPALYARSQGVVWDNSPTTVLSFARRYGVDAIAESTRNPIPADFLVHLSPEGSAGPFTLYRIEAGGAARATREK